jgi:hypothetical protein
MRELLGGMNACAWGLAQNTDDLAALTPLSSSLSLNAVWPDHSERIKFLCALFASTACVYI